LKAWYKAVVIRVRVLQSGDRQLVRIPTVLPDEGWARLRDILEIRGSDGGSMLLESPLK